MYIVYLECNISDWYSPNTLGRCWLTGQPFNPTVGRLVITPSPLSADWSTLQPHCRPTGHHSNIPCRPTGQPFNPIVGRLVITPTPLAADWSSLQHTLSADWSPLQHTLSADWSPLQHTLSADWSSLQPHCRPPHQTHHPTVGRLVTLTGHHLHLPCRPPS